MLGSVAWFVLRPAQAEPALNAVVAENPFATEGELGRITTCPDGRNLLTADSVGDGDQQRRFIVSVDGDTGAVNGRSELSYGFAVGCRDVTTGVVLGTIQSDAAQSEVALLSVADGTRSNLVRVDAHVKWGSSYDALRNRLYFAGQDKDASPVLAAVDLEAGTSWVLPVPNVGWVSFVTVTHDGNRAYVGYANADPAESRDVQGALSDPAKQAESIGGYVEVDLTSRQIVASHDLPSIPIDAAVSPDGERLFVSYVWALNSAVIVSAATGEVENSISIPNPGRSVFSRTGVRLPEHLLRQERPRPRKTVETIEVATGALCLHTSRRLGREPDPRR